MRTIILLMALILPSQATFGAGLGLNLSAQSGIGKTKNRTNSIASRGMWTHAFEVNPNYQMDQVDVGLGIAYAFRRQATEPGEVANTNFRGGGLSTAITGKYKFARLSLKGEIDFWGRYRLSNKDPVGQEIVYKCLGFCGFGISASSPVWNKLEVLAGLKLKRWSKVDVNSRENDISESRLMEWNAHLGVSHPFTL